MITPFKGPDRELRVINWVFVNGSMMLTAYFGWTLGEGVFVLAVVLAGLFAAVSRAAPLMTQYAAEYAMTGVYRAAAACAVFGGLFFFADLLTNYGAASAIRDNNIISAKHNNAVASDLRGEVTRLEKRISEIRATTQFQTQYLAPEAYDGLIESAELARKNEALRGGCKRKCEEKTEKLASLQADKANAAHRQALLSEMKTLESELVQAKLKAAATPTKASAALSQIKNLAGLLTLEIAPSEFAKTWTNSGIMAVGALLVSIGSVITAMILGLRIGQRRMEPYQDPPVAQNPYLPDQRPETLRQATPNVDPVDLNAWERNSTGSDAGAGSTYTFISNGKKLQVDGDWDAFDKKIAEALKFCQARGTA